MKNNTTKKIKTPEEAKTEDQRVAEFHANRQPYLDLLKSLDDTEAARKFRDKQFARAKELLSGIFMVTCGVFVKPDNKDWAQENLIELFEMFQIRHKNFSLPQFAEDLQEHIYRETISYSDASINWKRDILASRGLGEYGIEQNKKADRCILDMPEQSEESRHRDALALQISEVLKNPNLPVELYNAILHGTDDIINESSSDVSERFETSPEHIKAVLKCARGE